MAQLTEGWLVLPYEGPELADIEVKIGDDLYPAYLDYSGSKRVAKIRPPQDHPLRQGMVLEVWVNGAVLKLHKFNR